MAQMNMHDMLGLTPEQMEIARKTRYAEALRRQSEEPMNGQMVSGHYIAPSWTQGLAKMLSAYGSGKMERDAANEAKRYGEQQRTDFTDTAARYAEALRGTPEQQTAYEADNPFGEDLGNLQTVTPAQAGDPNKALEIALQSRSPMWQQFAMEQTMAQAKPAKPVVVGRSLIDPRSGQVVATDSTWAAEQQAARAQKIEELNMRLEDQRLNREQQAELRRELAAQQEAMRRDLAAQASADRRAIASQSSADRMAIARMADATRQQKNTPQLPTSALKMQQEELDALGVASTIQADLGAIKEQIDKGQLELGPVKNLISAGRNMAGLSDENSRNYGTFKSTLEKLRNDSLRLNNGVQTEGDAIRAWNELLANINDQKLVSRRLGEIQKINERAANLRKMQIDSIRSNFGVDPIETTQYQNQPAVVGTPTAPAGAKVKRFNPKTGRIE